MAFFTAKTGDELEGQLQAWHASQRRRDEAIAAAWRDYEATAAPLAEAKAHMRTPRATTTAAKPTATAAPPPPRRLGAAEAAALPPAPNPHARTWSSDFVETATSQPAVAVPTARVDGEMVQAFLTYETGRDYGFEKKIHGLLYANQRRDLGERLRRPPPLHSKSTGAKAPPSPRAAPLGCSTGALLALEAAPRPLRPRPRRRPRAPRAGRRRSSLLLAPPLAATRVGRRTATRRFTQLSVKTACLAATRTSARRSAASRASTSTRSSRARRRSTTPARAGLEAAVRSAACGASLDATDGKGNRALHVACERGHPEAAEALLGLGAGPTPRARAAKGSRPQDGLAPLHAACKHHHADVVFALLRAGARPDAPSRLGAPRDVAELFHAKTAALPLATTSRRPQDDDAVGPCGRAARRGARRARRARRRRRRRRAAGAPGRALRAAGLRRAPPPRWTPREEAKAMGIVTESAMAMQAAAFNGDAARVRALLARGANASSAALAAYATRRKADGVSTLDAPRPRPS
ncbi:spectrin binding protein [Aureococcus anophagefferens]|uniref:Spectrin binding protein n=1 Tax=Aureococcus anophagefferens TaxID=44056 RepID=A0ABR1FGN5_AURAN